MNDFPCHIQPLDHLGASSWFLSRDSCANSSRIRCSSSLFIASATQCINKDRKKKNEEKKNIFRHMRASVVNNNRGREFRVHNTQTGAIRTLTISQNILIFFLYKKNTSLKFTTPSPSRLIAVYLFYIKSYRSSLFCSLRFSGLSGLFSSSSPRLFS